MTPYSQRDVRWKDKKINGTQHTIGTDGCYITCLGMAVDLTPDVVEERIGFTGAQINYQDLDKIGLELVEKSNTYDNAKVTQYIADYGFCVVRVDWDGSPKSPGDTHFVLFIGNKRMIDPWTGNEVATSKYPLLTGYRAFRKVNMQTELEQCQIDRKKFWDERDSLHRALGVDSQEKAIQEIKRLQTREEEFKNHKCPVTQPTVPNANLILNGVNKEYVKDGVKITENYAIKG